MRDLVGQLNGMIREYRHFQELRHYPVVVAATACHGVNYIHPFPAGNGRTARATATLVLMGFGYLGIPKPSGGVVPVRSLEWDFDQHLHDDDFGLKAADEGYGELWLTVFSKAVAETMRIEQETRPPTPSP